MKKASRILTLLLVAVMVLGIFAGCDLFGKDIAKYRAATVFTVGDQNVTVAKLLDTFNSYYNSYYYYISAGYLTADQLFEMVFSSLYRQYAQVDDYVKNHEAINHDLSDFCVNAQYLTQAEVEYCISYVKYLTFQTFDEDLETKLSAKYELKDAEAADTSRDFAETDDLTGYDTYSDFQLHENFSNKDADEYFTKYYPGVNFGTDSAIDGYIYSDEAAAKVKLDEFNKRIDGDEQITFEELRREQENIVKQYTDSIKTAYKITMDDFVVYQTADLVANGIVVKRNYEIYGALEQDNNLTQTLDSLKSNLEVLRNAQEAEFNVNDNFDAFITSLTDSSFIFDVPEDLADKYVFVKNILIPFSGAQTNLLNGLANRLGSRTRQEYIDARNKYAAQIVADDFNSEKDDDGNYQKVENLFVLKDGNVEINPEGALGKFFGAEGVVTPAEGKTADQTVIDLMKQYNTDVGQHSSQYDYVVRIDAPEDYEHNWVDEFVAGTDAAADLGVKHYALAVSDYGVHIIYVVDYVKPQNFYFAADNYLSDTSSPSYRLFTTYFSSQSSLMLEEDLDELSKAYTDRVVISREFGKFLKENGFTFDAEQYLKDIAEGEEE